MNEIRIFLVDDHQIFRESLAELLNKFSQCQVVGQAGNGRTAISCVASAKPDIVLLDLSMPMMNGLNAIALIKRECPETKVVVLTMHDRESYISGALARGAAGYILKDISSDELLKALTTIKSGKTYLSEKINQRVIEEYSGLCKGQKYSLPLESLSSREREVFQLIVEGRTSKEIGQILSISHKTVEHHRSRVLSKLSCSNATQLIRLAAREGLLRE